MKQSSIKRKLTATLIMLSIILTTVSASAAGTVKPTFWTNTKLFTSEHLYIYTAKDGNAYDALIESANTSTEAFSKALSTAYIESDVNQRGTTMIISAKGGASAYYSGYLTSKTLNSSFKNAGGETVQILVNGLAVERSMSRYPDTTNLTDILMSDSELRGAVSGSWTVKCASSDADGELNIDCPFVLRFELDGKYKANEIRLVTAGDDGSIEIVDTDLKITRSDDTYYVRTGEIYSGIYCIVKK